MRISTSMIYQKGLNAIQQQTFDLVRTQQQVSTGKRILTPADDPIASARALELGQSRAVNSQFELNLGYADDNLKLFESKLSGLGDILQYSRERFVQAGSGAQTDQDLRYIATDLRAQFDAMVAIANSQDGQGEYIFAGYRSNVKPFEGGFGDVRYQGDSGERTIQVSASRYMPITLPGSEVFSNTRAVTDGAYAVNGRNNTGTAALTLQPGSEPPRGGVRYQIDFDGTDYTVTRRVPGRTDVVVPATLDAGPPPVLGFDGMEFRIDGDADEGDAFEVFVPSDDAFENFALAIDALERAGPASPADGAVAFALDNLDFAMENVLRVRAQAGSRLVEVDQLKNLGADLDLQYEQAISRLEDVDYAEAISRLARQQTFLQAAQQSYLRVTGLSLFNFLN